MDVLASAAIFEAMDINASDGGGTASGAADGNAQPIDMLKAAADVIMLDKENKEVRQRGCHPQVPGFEATLTTRVPIRGW